METALGWIGQIFDAILSCFPRLKIVRKTHAGVKYHRGGSRIKKMEPGLHLWWPLTTEVETYPIERQTTNLSRQTLTTKDGKVIGVGGIVVYRVRNIVNFLTKTYDGEDTIRDFALSAIAGVVANKNYQELHGSQSDLEADLTDALKGELRRFGVSVIKVSLSDFFPCDAVLATWKPGEDMEG